MRKSRKETAKTRQHIIDTASAEFRRKGVEGIGLSDLMAKAGLTHGGFYRHFQTKDDLVSEALGSAFSTSAQKLDETIEDMGFKDVVSDYLSEAHRDNSAHGCPFAALGAELVRCEKTVRDKATAGFLRQVKSIANKLQGLPPAEAHKRALVIMSSIAGAMTMSRVVTDPAVSKAILSETAKTIQFLASNQAAPTPRRIGISREPKGRR